MISYDISVVISNIWGILKWPDYPSFYGHVINTQPVHVCGCHCLVTETFPPSWSRSPVLLETAYSSSWCAAVVWMNSKTLCTGAMRWQIMWILTTVIRSPRAVVNHRAVWRTFKMGDLPVTTACLCLPCGSPSVSSLLYWEEKSKELLHSAPVKVALLKLPTNVGYDNTCLWWCNSRCSLTKVPTILRAAK